MITAAAIVAGAVAALLARPPGQAVLVLRGLAEASGRRDPAARASPRRWEWAWWWVASWWVVSWRRRAVARRRAATIELCGALAAELQVGASPHAALQRAASAVPGLCDEAGRVAALGGDVTAALTAASVRPGAGGLARLAAAWSASTRSGAGLAEGAERIAGWLREDESVRREVAAQLAGARSTARLLAVLPFVGLGLGAGMGAQPLRVLFGTTYGLVALVAGLALDALGVWWTSRLAATVERRVQG